MKPVMERFLEKISVSDSTCWNWIGNHNGKGYGRLWISPKMTYAYRFIYTEYYGEFPDSLDIDHLCRNHACVNPHHLEPVTRRENLLRGDTLPAKNVIKTHCPYGHEYNDDNTIIDDGSRKCRICRKSYDKKRRPGKKANQLLGN